MNAQDDPTERSKLLEVLKLFEIELLDETDTFIELKLDKTIIRVIPNNENNVDTLTFSLRFEGQENLEDQQITLPMDQAVKILISLFGVTSIMVVGEVAKDIAKEFPLAIIGGLIGGFFDLANKNSATQLKAQNESENIDNKNLLEESGS